MKTEVSCAPQDYNALPLRFIMIIPRVFEGEYQPLNISLGLEGTDDMRRFTLTNPILSPGAETVLSSHRQISTEPPSKSEYFGKEWDQRGKGMLDLLSTLQVIFLNCVLEILSLLAS